MSLPGMDRVDLSDAEVKSLSPHVGEAAFQSIYELEGSTAVASTSTVYELDSERYTDTHSPRSHVSEVQGSYPPQYYYGENTTQGGYPEDDGFPSSPRGYNP
jgi:hypothetical protein